MIHTKKKLPSFSKKKIYPFQFTSIQFIILASTLLFGNQPVEVFYSDTEFSTDQFSNGQLKQNWRNKTEHYIEKLKRPGY
jgi:hypothetical protein